MIEYFHCIISIEISQQRETVKGMKELSFSEAAQLLKVSPATVKNWTRQGMIATGNELNPLESDILTLKKQLTRKKSRRLTSRANKSSALRQFIPSEYIEKTSETKNIKILSETLKSLNADTPVVLLAFSLYLIYNSRLMEETWGSREEIPRIRKENLSREIALWHRQLNYPPLKELFLFINSLSIPVQRDTAGLIYQMLQSEGRKSEKGSYYTPPSLADEVLNQYGEIGQRFLDPCCGSGIFLLAAAQKYKTPENIYGWDTDITAVHLARINLMLHFKELDFTPHIFLRNSLMDISDEKFDLIATNPPWGHHFPLKDSKVLKERFSDIKTGESFSYFIQAGIKYLSDDGVLSYLLPEAILKVNTHRDIRKYLLDEVQIKYIKFLGKPFNRVQTRVIRMDLSNDENRHITTVFNKNKIYSVNGSRFLTNPFYLFDFNCSQKDYTIIESVYSKQHFTLKDNALWILGIVSGDNEKYISKSMKNGHLPFISGQNLDPYRVKKPEQYIYFNRKVLQQSAPIENYRQYPKIIYKFITGKPVFAIDRTGYVTLNSANSFYPQLDYPPESIAALFNSSLYHFICGKRFNSIKVLRSHLEELPLPHFTNREHSQFITLVKKIESSKKQNEIEALKENVNDLIFDYFHISDSDRKYILENI